MTDLEEIKREIKKNYIQALTFMYEAPDPYDSEFQYYHGEAVALQFVLRRFKEWKFLEKNPLPRIPEEWENDYGTNDI